MHTLYKDRQLALVLHNVIRTQIPLKGVKEETREGGDA
jgi:hypothetical protein